MAFRTVQPADYDSYLESEYPPGSPEEVRQDDVEQRQARLAAFPFAVMLQVAYPELDYANRWCWQQFGPAHGECQQSFSEYPACDLPGSHAHAGRWLTHWLAKTDYDYGYNEWYFAREADRNQFLEFVPHLNWGEHYSK